MSLHDDAVDLRPPFGGEPTDVSLRAARPQSLIISIYGAYSRTLDGWLSVSALLALMSEVGIDDPAVRSALSRFKRRGVLHSEKRAGIAGYRLSDSAWRTFDVGDARVLKRRQPPQEKSWVLAAFSIPESARDVRYRLRSRLARVGFAQVGGGLWIAPRSLEADVRYVVEALDVRDYVDVFIADHMAFRTTIDAVHQWWDLSRIASDYEAFTADFVHLQTAYERARKTPDPPKAFADYTRALTAWRPLPYADPGLPREYLPKHWAGDRASSVFYSLYDNLAEIAQGYVESLTPASAE